MIAFTLFIIWYDLSEGATEGYTWASSEQRKTNKIIRDKHNGCFMDYHRW